MSAAEPGALRTAIAVLYIAAITVFLVGVALRIIGGLVNVDALGVTGTLMNAGAWPIAVVAAILDVRQRRRAAL
ncbi:hypothetical protein [Subtercola sp. YIM 133946]|uniref:hypothetical protein n=1 Tax=Subtercola sp. YIM 133946 TaxID=3118909 RepID=UPI002F95B460